MKKLMVLIVAIALTLGLVGCSADTSSNLDINTDDITYVKDGRTGLCFAFIGSEKAWELSSTGMGFTNVPCDKVQKVLE